MMVVCFGDGLGNQMFQYAFFYSLKKRYSSSYIKMDINYIYGSAMHNGFELDSVFGIKREECAHAEALILADYFPQYLKRYIPINFFHKVRRVLLGVKKTFIVQEDATVFYPEVYQLNPLYSYMFKGNWINEKYFQEYRDELMNIFTFPPFDDDQNRLYMNEILAANSVSIHIRRGDYLQSPLYTLGIKYIQTAVQIINQKVNTPKYFVFTDDPEYVSKHFSFIDNMTVINGNKGKKSFRDMQLMSLCKHNIIANSTFSFWGAYLNRNTDKIVIAPRKAANKLKNPFACNDWIKIEAVNEE